MAFRLLIDFLRNAWHALFNIMRSIRLVNIIDIFLLTCLVYALLKMVRETRAGQLMKGVALLVAVYFVSDFIGLEAISWITLKLLNVGLIAIIIIFQPELRRILERFGQTTTKLSRFSLWQSDDVTEQWESAIPVICESVEQLSQATTGALIVIERGTKLGEQILNGTVMKALPSTQLFGNIFYNKTPLHDGAVIMRDGIIWAAACFLPKPQKEELIDKHLGSRHRAAIGMSENSDALIIVVSEETGQISVAQNGVLTRNYTGKTLEHLLRATLIPDESDTWRPSFLKKDSRKESPKPEEKNAPAAKKKQPPKKKPADRKEG